MAGSKSYFDDLNLIKNNLTTARSFTRGWHENITLFRDFYNFRHYRTKPKPGETQYVDPTPTNVVDLAVGILLANPPVWSAVSYRPGRDDVASDVEKFIHSLIRQVEDSQEINFIYELLLHFVRDGGVVLYTVWDRVAERRSKREVPEFLYPDGSIRPATIYEDIPLYVQIIDPHNILLLPGGRDRWAAIARVEMASVYDIVMRFGEDRLPEMYKKHLKNMDEAISSRYELVDYWDVVSSGEKEVIRHAILYGDEFIVPLGETPYRDFPYVIGLYKPTDRYDSGQWQSILSPVIPTVQLLERAINRRQRLIDLYASMPIVSKTVGGRDVSVDVSLGKVVKLQTDEDFGFPTWAGSPPDVDRQIELFRSRIQQSGFSDLFYGTGSSGASGYALSLLGDQNRIRLEQPIAHIENLLRRWANRVLDLILSFVDVESTFFSCYGVMREERFSHFIPAASLEGMRVFCELKPEFPNDRVRNHAMAVQVAQFLSRQTILEKYLGIQQPSDEMRRKVIEMAETHPALIQYAVMAELLEMANEGDEAAAMALQSIQAQSQAQPSEETSPPTSPGLPNRPNPTESPVPGQSPAEVQQRMSRAAPGMRGQVGRNMA